MDVVTLEELARPPQGLVVTAQRRAAIAGDEARGVEPGRFVAPALHQRQANQRLGAGDEDPTGFEGVLVVKRDCGERHRVVPAPDRPLFGPLAIKIKLEAPAD